jgi:cyclophilin family peptidyl-prolyl cis-trans isomerase
LTASLQPISNLTIPAQQGYTQPLLANSSATAPQTFTITSSNPDIAASIAQGPFWTVNVQYTDPTSPQNDFSGPLTFQLFQGLTPHTVSQIEQFTNDGYYTGKPFTRVATGFPPGTTDYVVQGGAPNSNGTGSSGQPGTPFANENVQQLAFTGTDQLAMANAGGTNSNDTQFFITTGSPNNELGYNYTIFGQMVSGQSTLTQMTKIPVQPNSALGGEDSLPVNPLIMSSVSLSSANPDGVAILDTTQAKAGETSTITVTATDATGNSVSQSFTVTVGAYGGPSSPAINFRPFANPVTMSAKGGVPTTVTLSGQSGYPTASTPSTLSYALVSQPAHGTISNFNATTGSFTYTPSPAFQGVDTFQYQVQATGPQTTPATTTSNPATVSITVSPAPPVNTGAVRVIGPVLIVTPLPRMGHHTNSIEVIQVPGPTATSGPVLEVLVNGQVDVNQPSTASIDGIIVFGSLTNDKITIDPSVTIPATIDGGHGGRNVLRGGGGFTREHGWFGFTTLVGGVGPNELIGRAGQVKFKPSGSTVLIFAGVPRRRTHMLNPTPPGGTFYEYKHGRLIPIPVSAFTTKATTQPSPTPSGGKHHRGPTHSGGTVPTKKK